MHFASLLVSLAVATTAFSMSISAKRDGYSYYPTFFDLEAATISLPDYLTYVLRETIPDCLDACDDVAGCNFVNSYHDNNGKDGSTLLTCALFKKCHDASSATNEGGQIQPDGSKDYITDSYGWCKKY